MLMGMRMIMSGVRNENWNGKWDKMGIKIKLKTHFRGPVIPRSS